MTREMILQASFNAGALSPRLAGRTDYKKYGASVSDMYNMIPMASGPATLRPGTRYVGEVKDTANTSKLVPFRASTAGTYILEFNGSTIRFYKQDGTLVLSGGLPYEVTGAFTDDTVISWAQDVDVLYLAFSGTLAPKVLVHVGPGDTGWVLRDMDFRDGPYYPVNTSTITITPSATTGSVTLTASASLWVASDVGRLVRYRRQTSGTTTYNWGWAVITAYTSATVVTATVQSDLGSATASTEWRLGEFGNSVGNGTTNNPPAGWPSVVTLHESRLVYGNKPLGNRQNWVWLSESQGYGQEKILFSPSASTGTVTDANAIYLPLSAGEISDIVWMSSGNQLAIGTTGSEWILESGDTTKALSPTNTRATRRTSQGSLPGVKAVRIDGTVLYAKSVGSKVQRFVFDLSKDDFKSVNLSLLAEHYFEGKAIAEMVNAPEPFSLIWVRFDDGSLAALTFVDDEEVGGWSRHAITNGAVESMAVIPATGNTHSELWMTVRRVIDEVTVTYIERMARPFFNEAVATEATYLDSSFRYSGAATSTITGLDHLEGSVVGVLVDGASHPLRTVTAGEITLTSPASEVVVGIPYVGELITLDFDAQNAFGGTSMGQIRRISQVALRLFETGEIYTCRADQTSQDDLNLLEPRSSDDFMDTATGLISGIVPVQIEANWDRSARLRVQCRSPRPATVSTIMIKCIVNEG